MAKVIIGIDPGVNGGVAEFLDGEFIRAVPMPVFKNPNKKSKVKSLIDAVGLRNYLESELCSSITTVIIEKAFAQKGQSNASYMQNYGMLLGICVGLGIPYVEISPKDWQKSQLNIKDCFKIRKDGTPVRDKAVSVRKVNELYPELKLKDKYDGIADAVLIGRYGLETLQGVTSIA